MKMTTENKIIIGGLVATIIGVIWVAILLSDNSTQPTPNKDLVASSGLHWHPQLTITIDGKKQEIPANIGIAGSIHKELHTHETDGIIHMEMAGLVTKDETRLGDFFKIWGKGFSRDQIFDKKNGEEGTVKMFVNGQDNYNFENYEMKDGDNIEIRYE